MLRHCSTRVKDKQKINENQSCSLLKLLKSKFPGFTPTSPFFQLIPWKHSKIKRFDTVPSESGLQKMCIHILFSSAKCSVITAVQRPMCALTKPRASFLAEGILVSVLQKGQSSAPGAPLGGTVYPSNWFFFFSNVVSLWCYNCKLICKEFTLFKKCKQNSQGYSLLHCWKMILL